jgi:hypothetical protein
MKQICNAMQLTELSYTIGGLSHSLVLTRRLALWQKTLRRKETAGNET